MRSCLHVDAFRSSAAPDYMDGLEGDVFETKTTTKRRKGMDREWVKSR